ncbi:MAG: short-chain dehydrogenase [Chloroflexi bacterium HGW-Chloroflexi-5]|jgi:NAD(P)-dependent dehydrogenase (short-subunit alcohol dehydrogenase family)|nr:MAG: short-chain dehydrogenase [Chloroflexi bacterium HGW-Chloroflexi-5]
MTPMKWPDELIFIPNSRKTQKTTTARMDGRLCVITGATSGVGYHAADRLAEGGARLVLVCRNAEKGNKVKEELESKHKTSVQIVKADFAHLSQVRKAAAAILEDHPRIDVLINNAGIHNTKRNLTNDGVETVFHVNHLASFLFTELLLPRILTSAPARVIQINSQGHRFGGLDLNDLNWDKRRYHGLQGYGASKVAQLLTAWELADRLKESGVTINAMHPGAVRTNIGMNNNSLYQWYQRYLLWPLLKDARISGEAIYYLAAAPEMAEVSGRFFNLTIDEKPAGHALDRDLGKQVWKVSNKLTGLEATDV